MGTPPTNPSSPSRRSFSRRLLISDENNPPSPSKFAISRQRSKGPLEEHDHNSQDSGYAQSEDSKSSNFRFAEPNGVAPKSASVGSPRRSLHFSSFGSDGSCPSLDDSFMELLSSEKDDENAQLPSGLGGLLSNPILTNRPSTPIKDTFRRTTFRRCISESSTPKRVSWPGESANVLKRPPSKCPESVTPTLKKHRPLAPLQISPNTAGGTPSKGTLFQYGFKKVVSPPPAKVLERTVSDSEINIKLALQRSTQEELIGDFSRPFALPLIAGKHQDLKAISCDTLAALMSGHFTDTIRSFRIIDCRYPYEFAGGHIKGAVNLYTSEHITKELLSDKQRRTNDGPVLSSFPPDLDDKRDILVFHCEFSSERGPFLSRFLRKKDRAGNDYPLLHYPELYLLDGGYKAFFSTHSHLCEPRSYLPMHHPDHSSELKHFRAKSKSWAGSHKAYTARSLSRLNF